jgi:hypothetical protein
MGYLEVETARLGLGLSLAHHGTEDEECQVPGRLRPAFQRDGKVVLVHGSLGSWLVVLGSKATVHCALCTAHSSLFTRLKMRSDSI